MAKLDHSKIGYYLYRLAGVLVPRFPYGVIYCLEADRMRVVAVANLYRRPGYWRARS